MDKTAQFRITKTGLLRTIRPFGEQRVQSGENDFLQLCSFVSACVIVIIGEWKKTAETVSGRILHDQYALATNLRVHSCVTKIEFILQDGWILKSCPNRTRNIHLFAIAPHFEVRIRVSRGIC